LTKYVYIFNRITLSILTSLEFDYILDVLPPEIQP